MMEIFKYGLGYSCTSNLRAYSREIRTLARPHQQCHGRSFLKTESREPWIELLRSFFPRDGKAAIWDGRPPCEFFFHTDAQKSDNISIIVFYTSSHPGCGPIPSQDASIQVRPTCRSHSLWKFLSIGPKFSSDMLKLGQIKPKSYIVGLYEFMKQFWIRYGNNPIDALGLTMILVIFQLLIIIVPRFNLNQKIAGRTENNSRKNVKIRVPLKYLSKFWQTLVF